MNDSEALVLAEDICSHQGWEVVGPAGTGTFKYTFEVMANGTVHALKIHKQPVTALGEREVREIEAMKMCDHPHIAKLAAVGTHNKHLYTVEEFLAGGSLEARLSRGLLSVEELLALGAPLVGALVHLEGKHLIHRDLKPQNIMLRTDGSPVLVDMGIVRNLALTSLTETGAFQPKTRFYAAPEQLNNQKEMIDSRTDQFALGIVLSFAAFGRHPYDEAGDGDASQIIDRVTDSRPPALWFQERTIAEGLPCLRRMVQPWPYKRYRSAGDVQIAWGRQGARQ